MKRLLLAVLILIMLAGSAWGTAQTAKVPGPNSFGIVCSGDADYTFPSGFVQWILWKPSAASDVLCIRDVADTGPALIYATSVDGSSQVIYVGGVCTPYFDYSACTIGTGANYEVTAFYLK